MLVIPDAEVHWAPVEIGRHSPGLLQQQHGGSDIHTSTSRPSRRTRRACPTATYARANDGHPMAHVPRQCRCICSMRKACSWMAAGSSFCRPVAIKALEMSLVSLGTHDVPPPRSTANISSRNGSRITPASNGPPVSRPAIDTPQGDMPGASSTCRRADRRPMCTPARIAADPPRRGSRDPDSDRAAARRSPPAQPHPPTSRCSSGPTSDGSRVADGGRPSVARHPLASSARFAELQQNSYPHCTARANAVIRSAGYSIAARRPCGAGPSTLFIWGSKTMAEIVPVDQFLDWYPGWKPEHIDDPWLRMKSRPVRERR